MRYRRFEPQPQPVAQAVMFCLMDVSGSMTEHMKDLAKRFYVLLYIFLKRRYKHVEMVFIRHTHQAPEVDEDTFFHSPETGGTVVSTALEEMQRVVDERYSPDSWNIYAAQASDGDNTASRQRQDGGAADRARSCRSASTTPISRSAATPSTSRPASSGATPICGRPTRRSAKTGAPMAMRKVGHRRDIYPVFRELFAKKQATDGSRDGMNDFGGGIRAERPLFEGADWDFGTIQRVHDAIEEIARRRARPRRLSQPDRGHQHRADARCLFLDRHAAVLQALVVRQALRPQRGDVPRRHAGPRL